MADFQPTHPLGDVAALNAEFASSERVSIVVREGFACAQIFAKKGKESDLASKLKIGTTPGEASETDAFSAIPLSPGQWMLVSKKDPAGFAASMDKKIGRLGHVSDQSDSRVCIRVTGPDARALMSRGCRLDLHPSVTSSGFCAQTNMAQTGVMIHQIDDQPTYDLYVYSGCARSFWQWLSHTAHQFS